MCFLETLSLYKNVQWFIDMCIPISLQDNELQSVSVALHENSKLKLNLEVK